MVEDLTRLYQKLVGETDLKLLRVGKISQEN